MNRATLLGIVGRDPKIFTFKNGDRAAGFSMATTERWKDKNGERKEATEWHNIKVYGGLVDVVESYVKKGTKILVEGKIKTTKYEKDGVEKQSFEIVLQGPGTTFQLLSAKDGAKPESKPKPDHRDHDEGGAGGTTIDDDIPF